MMDISRDSVGRDIIIIIMCIIISMIAHNRLMWFLISV